MEKAKVVALLPIKEHSQRIPNKNFRLFYGRPLFSWILSTLLQVNLIDEIIINTDSMRLQDEIDKLMIPHTKLTIRHRAPHLCGDRISMNLIIEDDLAHSDADTYIMTHATNPLLTSTTIIHSINLYHNLYSSHKNDSLFTVTRIQERVYTNTGIAVNHSPDCLIQTQDLHPCFIENSNLYIFNKQSFKETNHRIGKKPYFYEMDEFESVDIDTESDWRKALLYATVMYSDVNA